MAIKEGNLEAPKRAPIDWKTEDYYDKGSLYSEMERVFDACHGCRRCVSLCESFPTLFDLIDESETFEVDGVSQDDYVKVVDECFLCDLCAETKCPYLPPHEWAIDFPHLMLRAKAQKYEAGQSKWRDRLLTSTDSALGALSAPLISKVANKSLSSKPVRKLIDKTIGIHKDSPLPVFGRPKSTQNQTEPNEEKNPEVRSKVAIFASCYDKYTEESLTNDLIKVLEHNNIPTITIKNTNCCGMPKLELGNLKQVEHLKNANVPVLLEVIEAGYEIISTIPSCVLMYKQEIPLMFPDEEDLVTIKKNFYDPFEYLMQQEKKGSIKLDFTNPLGKVSYHAACHQRVQNFGAKTRDFLNLIPDTEVSMIERCSGHDGIYAVKSESYEKSLKIVRPVQRQVNEDSPEHIGSDCPMAGRLITHNLKEQNESMHPISMVRYAYGL